LELSREMSALCQKQTLAAALTHVCFGGHSGH
jgi:hypothetical protein